MVTLKSPPERIHILSARESRVADADHSEDGAVFVPHHISGEEGADTLFSLDDSRILKFLNRPPDGNDAYSEKRGEFPFRGDAVSWFQIPFPDQTDDFEFCLVVFQDSAHVFPVFPFFPRKVQKSGIRCGKTVFSLGGVKKCLFSPARFHVQCKIYHTRFLFAMSL